MDPLELFGISLAVSTICAIVLAAEYIWPWTRTRDRIAALKPLLLVHGFRFIGLAFLIPGVVSPELPAAFARPAAYGDLLAALAGSAGVRHAFTPGCRRSDRSLGFQHLG